MGRSRLLLRLLGVIPVTFALLWLFSGREAFTKSQKTVTVRVRQEPFGDELDRSEFVAGPIVGYFIGLDAVIISSAVSGVLALAVVLLNRRRGPKRLEE